MPTVTSPPALSASTPLAPAERTWCPAATTLTVPVPAAKASMPAPPEVTLFSVVTWTLPLFVPVVRALMPAVVGALVPPMAPLASMVTALDAAPSAATA